VTVEPSLEKLLARVDVDGVVIAVPNDLHESLAVQALRAGKHVLLEKPMAPSVAECDSMIAACERAGVVFEVIKTLRFRGSISRALQLIADGAIGRVRMIDGRTLAAGTGIEEKHWAARPESGGMLLDMGCHGIGVARWLKGNAPVVEVSAQLGTYVHHEHPVEDHSLVTLRFADGTIAVIDSSWAAPGGIDERLEVLGTAGHVIADLARGQSLLAYSDAGFDATAEKVVQQAGLSWIAHDEAWTWGWHGEFAHFADVLAGRAEPLLTGADGLEILAIVGAAYVAAAEHRVVMPPWPTGDHLVVQPWLDRRR